MIPLLFQLGPFPLYTFGLCVALAMIAATFRLQESFVRDGIPAALADKVVMTAGVTGLLGARVWFIGEHWQELGGDLWSAFSSNAGFTFYGGFIIATCVVLWMGKRRKIGMCKFIDSMGPALALGYAIGRLGCQLSGDGDYGIMTTNFWGMSYATGVVPTPPGILVYPTPLFESAIAMATVWILIKAENSGWWRQVDGRRFGLYLVTLSIERFMVEFIRPNDRILGSFSEAQCIAVLLIVLGLSMVMRPAVLVANK